MVGANEVLHLGGQVVTMRQFKTVGHMARNQLGALDIVEFVVRIESGVLVFGKVERVADLADVVVESADLGEKGVATQFTEEVFGDIGDLDRMLEGARRTA